MSNSLIKQSEEHEMTTPKSEDTPTTVDDKFTAAIERFSQSLMDLREFSELIETLIKKHKIQELEAALGRYEGLGEALSQFDDSFRSEIHQLQEGCPDEQPGCGSRLAFKVKDDGNGKMIFHARGDRDDIKEFDKTFMAILRSENGVIHLHRSSLISLVSIIEVFISKLLHIFFETHPSAANSSDKQFTFRELSAFSSLDDAKQYLVSYKIENLLRGSFDDWIAYFSNELKLKLTWLAQHQDELIENFQRRNLFVHNDGVVNKIYLSKVSTRLSKPELLNKRLKVSKNYLFEAIDRFESAFLQTSFELWEKCDKRSERRPAFMVNSTYEALQNNRWKVAHQIAQFMEGDKVANESIILMAKINGWIARSRMEGLDAVKADIEAFDVSAKDDVFRLARHCLLEEDAKAIALCKRLEKEKKLSLRDLMDWPLFDKLRDKPAMASWLAKLKDKAIPKPKNKDPAAKTTQAAESVETNKTAKTPLARSKRNVARSPRVPAK